MNAVFAGGLAAFASQTFFLGTIGYSTALVAAFASPASVEITGSAPPESVDTEAEEMAGFALGARRPRPGTTMPAALR